MNQTNASPDASIKRIGGIVIQIAGPALTMLVVSSIAFFLIEISYSGPYVGRVKWIFALFSFAAVLISRISIEEGFERASVYGFLLGAATLAVSAGFMQGNPLFLVVILTFVWWSAGRLTWDCTFIDDSRDVTGQGMIDLAIDRVTRFRTATVLATEARSESDPHLPGAGPTNHRSDEDTTINKKVKGPWAQFVRIFWKRKQANSPGLWAFYFLLGGVPLFGIGQMMMSMTDSAAHQAAVFHFFTYVVGLLGLLMLSSVLGLHRYLQANQSAMPGTIARRWITVGTVLAIGITGFCFLLPRPSAKYSIGSWLPKMTTQAKTSSDQSVGRDGQQQNKNNSNVDAGPKSRDNRSPNQSRNEEESGGGNTEKTDDGAPSDKKGGDSAGGKSNDGKAGTGGSKKENSKGKARENDGKQKGSGGESNKKSKHNSNEGQSEKGDPEKGESEQGESEQGESDKESGDQKNARHMESKSDNASKSKEKKKAAGGAKSGKSRSARKSSGSPNRGSKKKSSPKEKKNSNFGGLLTGLVKLFMWIVGLLVFAWFVIKYRSQIGPAIRSFLAEMAEFWNRLWNRKRKPKRDDPAATQERTSWIEPLPGFSRFENPFKTSAAKTWSPEKLVTYTFQAFEAWSREHSCAREPEQTAHEFARSTTSKFKTLAIEVQNLANLYSQLAYDTGDSGAVSRSAAMGLSTLWEKLTMMHAPGSA